MKSEFEKAYEPNPHKSPFTEVRFNDEKQIYEPLNPPLDHVARSLNAAWYGYRIRQNEVDELQKRLDAQTKHIETALLAVKDIHKSARDEFMDWDVLAEKAPKLCQHMQDLSFAVGVLEQALKGEQAFFMKQPFYLQLKYIHGDRLFDFDQGIGYRNLTVQVGYVCWCKGDKEFVI